MSWLFALARAATLIYKTLQAVVGIMFLGRSLYVWSSR